MPPGEICGLASHSSPVSLILSIYAPDDGFMARLRRKSRICQIYDVAHIFYGCFDKELSHLTLNSYDHFMGFV